MAAIGAGVGAAGTGGAITSRDFGSGAAICGGGLGIATVGGGENPDGVTGVPTGGAAFGKGGKGGGAPATGAGGGGG